MKTIGQTAFVEGYEFRIAEIATWSNGKRYFRGVCTDDSRNDSIRNTAYNGGWYLLPEKG